MNLGIIDQRDLRPTRDIVFEILRNAILDGRLGQGERIMETTIAEELNISRTPVREAFRKLEIEGLIEYFPKKGTIVKGITVEDIIEIYDMREVLEGLAVRLACRNIRAEEIRELRDILQKMKFASDSKDYNLLFSLHDRYNSIIVEASNSKRLKDNLLYLYEYIASFRKITLAYDERRNISLSDHKKIVDLMEKGDEYGTEECCRNHIRKAKETILLKQI